MPNILRLFCYICSAINLHSETISAVFRWNANVGGGSPKEIDLLDNTDPATCVSKSCPVVNVCILVQKPLHESTEAELGFTLCNGCAEAIAQRCILAGALAFDAGHAFHILCFPNWSREVQCHLHLVP